jgi:hypothetical protein
MARSPEPPALVAVAKLVEARIPLMVEKQMA